MRVPRIYVNAPLLQGKPIAFSGDAANHIGRVLRLKSGAEIVAFNGDGFDYHCELISANRHEAEALVKRRVNNGSESPLKITLVQGISRGERMDFTLQKCVELGVAQIAPVIMERTVVRLPKERAARRLEHWRKVVVSASEQSGRAKLPELRPICGYPEWLDSTPVGEQSYILVPNSAAKLWDPVTVAACRPTKITIIIGPEGGMSENEIEQALARGVQAAAIGPRILRTETAALAAIALLQAYWGDM